MEKSGLIGAITGMAWANLRLIHVDGGRSDRPYATDKLHIDIWANEPDDIVHLWIPVLGDFENAGFELRQGPTSIDENEWLRVYDSYDAVSVRQRPRVHRRQAAA